MQFLIRASYTYTLKSERFEEAEDAGDDIVSYTSLHFTQGIKGGDYFVHSKHWEFLEFECGI